jgi:hypothetical protein
MNKRLRETVINHLGDYKERHLGIEACGVWWKNKKEYRHILPENLSNANIIDKGYRPDIAKMIVNKNRHLGFHHMNSSQALAANLFGPFVSENKIDRLNSLFGLELSHGKGCFEYIHNSVEGTNFDFAVNGMNARLFVEVKYTENQFGSATGDQRHLGKYESVYRDRLRMICNITMDEFLKDYQLWRNIIYIESGTVAFVIPKFRTDLAKKVEATRKRIASPEKVRLVWIDDISRQGESETSANFRPHFLEFKKKYLEVSCA